MTRGRKKDLTIPPSRALAQQRDYRARKAQYVSLITCVHVVLIIKKNLNFFRLSSLRNVVRPLSMRICGSRRS